MAIAADLPGLDVTIEVAGIALPEHDYNFANDHEVATSTVKYVETPLGAEFAIRCLFRPPFTPPSAVSMEIMLDGNYLQVPFMERGDRNGYEGYLYSKAALRINGQNFTQTLRFSQLTTEETNTPVSKELQQQLAPIGRIVLYFYLIEHIEAVTPAEVPRLATSDLGVLGEKVIHKTTSVPGDALTLQTSLAAPEQRESIDYNHIKHISNEPFASFTFFYRSTDALKSLGVIPRTPSPEPELEAEEKDLDAMTEEEMREELKRTRQRQHDAIKVERERAESQETLSDDEVTWLGTQPSNHRLKKLRRGPNVGDEVVVLDE